MNEHTRDVVLFEINIFAADIDIESEPNRVYHWNLNRGCDWDKHCVYSCRFMWGLADYWRSMSNRVTENLSVQNYRFNGPGVRRSAVLCWSSLATISIRLFCKNNINLSDTLGQDGSKAFLWQEVPPQQVTFPWSHVIHNLKIAKFISMIVFWLDLGSYLVRKKDNLILSILPHPGQQFFFCKPPKSPTRKRISTCSGTDAKFFFQTEIWETTSVTWLLFAEVNTGKNLLYLSRNCQ